MSTAMGDKQAEIEARGMVRALRAFEHVHEVLAAASAWSARCETAQETLAGLQEEVADLKGKLTQARAAWEKEQDAAALALMRLRDAHAQLEEQLSAEAEKARIALDKAASEQLRVAEAVLNQRKSTARALEEGEEGLRRKLKLAQFEYDELLKKIGAKHG